MLRKGQKPHDNLQFLGALFHIVPNTPHRRPGLRKAGTLKCQTKERLTRNAGTPGIEPCSIPARKNPSVGQILTGKDPTSLITMLFTNCPFSKSTKHRSFLPSSSSSSGGDGIMEPCDPDWGRRREGLAVVFLLSLSDSLSRHTTSYSVSELFFLSFCFI